jgi:hypothetical protein
MFGASVQRKMKVRKGMDPKFHDADDVAQCCTLTEPPYPCFVIIERFDMRSVMIDNRPAHNAPTVAIL